MHQVLEGESFRGNVRMYQVLERESFRGNLMQQVFEGMYACISFRGNVRMYQVLEGMYMHASSFKREWHTCSKF